MNIVFFRPYQLCFNVFNQLIDSETHQKSPKMSSYHPKLILLFNNKVLPCFLQSLRASQSFCGNDNSFHPETPYPPRITPIRAKKAE